MSFLDDVKARIDRAKVVSFDIFDTLLVRPYVRPIDLFQHMEQHFSAPGFATARIQAEKAARAHHRNVEEITLDEIYDEIVPAYHDFKQHEKDFEHQVLIPNPRLKPVFDYARAAGKKIIVISDMYLDREFLADTLKAKGYDGISKIYVSSEYKKMKMTGNLFPIVLDDLDCAPADVFHMGDNYESDYAIPFSYGMDACFFYKNIEMFFHNDPRVDAFYQAHKSSLGISIMLGVMSYIYATGCDNYWRMFGFKYAGPLIYAYTTWLKNQLTADDIRDVLFVARDGYTLKKVFDIITAGQDFNTSYVYASRVFDVLFNLNYEQKVRVDPLEGIATLRKIINYYRSMDDTLAAQTPDEIPDCETGLNFVNKHIDIYRQLAARRREDYTAYIRPLVSGRRVGMVDTLSIHMSSQCLLEKFCAECDSSICGYYFAVPKSPKVDYTGKDYRTFQQSANWEFVDWDFCEFLITSPESPIQDITPDGTPIYKKQSLMEKSRSEAYRFVSDGAIMFATLMREFFGDITVNISARDVTEWINNFCLIASESDRPQISLIKHGYDSNHDTYVPICKPWFATPGTFGTRRSTSVYKYKLFGFLPLLKIVMRPDRFVLTLLGCIPLFKSKYNGQQLYILGIPLYQIKQTPRKRLFMLFKFIPLFSIKGK